MGFVPNPEAGAGLAITEPPIIYALVYFCIDYASISCGPDEQQQHFAAAVSHPARFACREWQRYKVAAAINGTQVMRWLPSASAFLSRKNNSIQFNSIQIFSYMIKPCTIQINPKFSTSKAYLYLGR